MSYSHSITGNLVNAYYICSRKLWLFAHEISPDPQWELLELGRLITDESYSRDKKELATKGMKIDIIQKTDGKIIIGEIKKSSKGLTAAQMQLAYYLYRMKKQGVNLSGELLIPKEKKRIKVDLTPDIEAKLETTFKEMKRIIAQEKPPMVQKSRLCKRCAYREFCLA